MKKTISFLLSVCLFMTFCIEYADASTAKTQYSFPQFTIQIPNDYLTFTRENVTEIVEKNAQFGDLSLFIDFFENDESLYLDAINSETFDEICIRVLPLATGLDIRLLKDYDDDFIAACAEGVHKAYLDQGLLCDPPLIYRHSQTVFFLFEHLRTAGADEQGCTVQYFTMLEMDGVFYSIAVTGISLVETMSDAFSKSLEEIINSINLAEHTDGKREFAAEQTLPTLEDQANSQMDFSQLETLTLDVVDLSFKYPEGLRVLSYATQKNDPILSEFAIDYQTLLSMLSDSKRYAYFFDDEGLFELSLFISSSSLVKQIGDFHALCETALLDAGWFYFTDLYDPDAVDCVEMSTLENSQTTWIEIDHSITINNQTEHRILYYTGIDGQTILLSYRYGGNSAEDDALYRLCAETMIKHFRFGETWDIAPASAQMKSSSVWNSADNKVSFVLPDGWLEIQPVNTKEYPDLIKARFVPHVQLGTEIMYASFDMWNMAKNVLPKGTAREDVDTEYLYQKFSGSLQHLSDFVGIRVDSCWLESIAEKSFLKIKTSNAISSVYGELQQRYIIMMKITNGVAHMFYFTAHEKSPLYRDFLTVLQFLQLD